MQKRLFSLSLIAFLGLSLLTVSGAEAASKSCYNKKAKGLVVKVSGNTCVMNKARSKWVPAVKSGACYTEKKKKVKAAHRTACRGLLGSQLKRLSQLPSTAKLAKASGSGASVSAVSGEPPVLSDIPAMDLKTLFWRDGVVDGVLGGTPTELQCSEFFNGDTDGYSGGMNACNLTAGVGYSFEPILSSGTSACYMKNFPTLANMEAGALTLVSGTFPGNDPAKMFNPPATSDRLVKVMAADPSTGDPQNIFIKVFSTAHNDTKGYRYRYDLWFCDSDSGSARQHESTYVAFDGKYHASNSGMNEHGSYSSSVDAYLASESGSIVFDTDRDRRADVSFEQQGGGSFKSRLLINSDDEIHNLMYDLGQMTRKAYSISNFSGNSTADLRFLQGAYKDIQYMGDTPLGSYDGAVEYRDTFYASAPASAYLAQLDAVNLATDSFYASVPSVDFDTSGYSCSADADIVIGMDMQHQVMQQIASECEQDRLDNMNFCWENTDLQNAMQGVFTSCQFGPPQQ